MTHQNVGRPKIYHTEEEKRLGYAKSSNRFYWNNQTKTKEEKHIDRVEAKRVRNEVKLHVRAVRKEVKDTFVKKCKDFDVSQLRLIEAYICELAVIPRITEEPEEPEELNQVVIDHVYAKAQHEKLLFRKFKMDIVEGKCDRR